MIKVRHFFRPIVRSSVSLFCSFSFFSSLGLSCPFLHLLFLTFSQADKSWRYSFFVCRISALSSPCLPSHIAILVALTLTRIVIYVILTKLCSVKHTLSNAGSIQEWWNTTNFIWYFVFHFEACTFEFNLLTLCAVYMFTLSHLLNSSWMDEEFIVIYSLFHWLKSLYSITRKNFISLYFNVLQSFQSLVTFDRTEHPIGRRTFLEWRRRIPNIFLVYEIMHLIQF